MGRERGSYKKLSNEQQFLIVTEGSTDANIIRKALNILKPDIADFFRFVDMAEGYPFSGTGNLHNFCKGLISIGYANPTIILYDNDTEGTSKFLETKKLSLPQNMRVTKLPNLPDFEKFETIGAHGRSYENINGKGAAIECYLDLSCCPQMPLIRWMSYDQKTDSYQGVLVHKEIYSKKFFELSCRTKSYDFSKLEVLLQHIILMCSDLASDTSDSYATFV